MDNVDDDIQYISGKLLQNILGIVLSDQFAALGCLLLWELTLLWNDANK